MAEGCKPENVFVQKHQGKSNRAEIQKIKKDGTIGSCSRNLRKVQGLKQYDPGGDYQHQHDDIILGELEIFPVNEVGKKKSKEIRQYGYDDIEYRKDSTFILFPFFRLGHFAW